GADAAEDKDDRKQQDRWQNVRAHGIGATPPTPCQAPEPEQAHTQEQEGGRLRRHEHPDAPERPGSIRGTAQASSEGHEHFTGYGVYGYRMVPWSRAHVLEEGLAQAIDDAENRAARIQPSREKEPIGRRIEPDHVFAADLRKTLSRPISPIGI